MLSLVTVSLVITAFHSYCLSHHVFDLVNLWLAWVGFETAIFWQCSPGTVETQRLYPLRHGPRRAIKVGFFGLINPIICSERRNNTKTTKMRTKSQSKVNRIQSKVNRILQTPHNWRLTIRCSLASIPKHKSCLFGNNITKQLILEIFIYFNYNVSSEMSHPIF